MRLIFSLWLAGLLTIARGAPPQTEPVSQEPQAVETPPVMLQETPSTPAEPQRVIGQARSEEEATAFNALAAETDQDLKISKGHQFLQAFPDSGLTPLVHSELAEVYRIRVDVDNFLKHGEEALKEIPDMVNLLAAMSFYYAEGKQPFKAAESATKALAILGTLERPSELTPSQWMTQKFFLSGEAHYALGRVQLGQAQRLNPGGPADVPLQEAVKHFQQSLEANPIHEFAAYRLAETYERQADTENAVKLYARAAAMEGNIGAYAQQRLEQIYKEHPGLAPMAEVVALQKQTIEKAQQERKQLQAQIEAESAPVDILAPAPPASSQQPPQDEPGGNSGAVPGI